MRFALGIASLSIAGCALGNSIYDCPLRQPSKKEFALIEAAARLEGVERINRESLEYCRQRGDDTRFAKWKTEATALEDGSEAWKAVGCVDEAYEKGGWGCFAQDVRGIRLRLSAARPVVPIAIPKDMSVAEATRLVTLGFSPFDGFGVGGRCHAYGNSEFALEEMRKQAALEIEWRLEAAESAGEFRLVNEPYYILFGDSSAPGAAVRHACWDEFEYLE